MRKTVSILLASLVLAISMHLGFATHLCGDELAQAKMVYGYGEAGCGMDCSISSTQPNQQETNFQKTSCCQGFIFTIAVDEYQSVSQKVIFTAHQNIHTKIMYVFTPDFFIVNTYRSSNPLPHIRGILLPFIQVFLI